MHTPKATVRLAGEQEPRVVVFTLGRLEVIEEALGKSAAAIVIEDLGGLSSGETEAETLERRMKSLRAGFLRRFVAACLDLTPDALDLLVPPKGLISVFTPLVEAFAAAVMGMLGGGDEASAAEAGPAGHPPAGPASAS